MTGTLTLDGTPALRIPGGSNAGYVLVSDQFGNAVWSQSAAVIKAAVQEATTGALPNSPAYFNGTAGFGATLTAASPAVLAVDGVTVALNDRVLATTVRRQCCSRRRPGQLEPGGALTDASPGSTSASVITATPVQTSAYAANPGEFVRTDTTGGSLTVTLPPSPPANTVIGVKQVATPGPNTTTVACSGADCVQPDRRRHGPDPGPAGAGRPDAVQVRYVAHHLR